jgi:hypothetical protein
VSVRVYLPATVPSLADAISRGSVAAEAAFAVTPALRAALPGADDEELENAAASAAADAALLLLADDPAAPRRRVVLAADVDTAAPADGHPAAVRVAAVPVAGLRAILADDPAAGAAVAAAVADSDAAAALEADLLWYAVQEADEVLHG